MKNISLRFRLHLFWRQLQTQPAWRRRLIALWLVILTLLLAVQQLLRYEVPTTNLASPSKSLTTTPNTVTASQPQVTPTPVQGLVLPPSELSEQEREQLRARMDSGNDEMSKAFRQLHEK